MNSQFSSIEHPDHPPQRRGAAWLAVAVCLIATSFASTVRADEAASTAAAGDAETANVSITPEKLGMWVSRLHPATVHFPIALIVAACLAEFVGIVKREPSPTPAARFCLALGTAGAVAAGVTGWLKFVYGPMAGVEPDDAIKLHRLVGTIAGGWTIALLIAGHVAARRKGAFSRWTYRLMLLAGAALVGATGHLGGALVFGEGYLSFSEL